MERSIMGEGPNKWYVDGALNTPDRIKQFTEYYKDVSVDVDGIKQFKQFWDSLISKDILPIPTLGGIAYNVWSAIGMKRMSYIARKYQNSLHDLVNSWLTMTKDAQTVLFENEVDMVFVCDDYAQKDRLMVSPKTFETFFEPAYKKLADNAHKHGAKILMHSDGDLTDSLPALKRAGFDAIEPLEFEAGMRLDILKEKWGDTFALFGNVPASDALVFGNKNLVIKHTLQCILDAAEGGGFVLAASANILADSNIENVQTMIETTRKYGTYPIDRLKIKNKLATLH